MSGGMMRRGYTTVIGGLIVLALTFLVGQARVPYVQLEPGPTFDTLGKDDSGKDVIVLKGATATTSLGQLRFVTVGVRPDLTLLQALRGWLSDDDAVVPRELIYPPGRTEEEVDRQNAEQFTDSQSAAEIAALAELGYPSKITVKTVAPDTPADGKLRPGDVINKVDGVSVHTTEKLLELIRGKGMRCQNEYGRAKPVGTVLTFEVTRAGRTEIMKIATQAGEDGKPRVGFAPELTSTAPFTLDFPIEGVGGPSAGLMFSLGIIDKIKPEDMTGGKIIAGTGAIEAPGDVCPIGGVPQKLVSAKGAGATYFLTPKANCAEAVANQEPGLALVQVGTLDEALAALQAISRGGQPQLCPGASG